MKEKINYMIRKVEPKDAREFIELRELVWQSAYRNIFPKEVFDARKQEQEKRIASFTENFANNNEKICYVAEYDGKLIGLMAGNIKSPNANFEKKNFADLTILYIHPDFQHIGVGSNLKKVFEEWARENGAQHYVIGVLKDNSAARKVYESWGGKLDKFSSYFTQLGKNYEEVFYTYNLELEKKL